MSFQTQIDEINQSLDQISAGVIKLMVDAVEGKAVYETIIKTEDGKEYIICQDKIKAIEMQADGDYQETIINSETKETQEIIDALKKSIKDKLESGIEHCCANIKSVAQRPSIAENLIEIKEPATIEDCYEFTLIAEGHKYVMIDDDCPYLLERIASQNGEEETIVLSSSQLAEAIERIALLLIPVIVAKSFEEAEIVELTKDAEFCQAIIDELRQKIQLLPACIIDDEENGELIIRGSHHTYSVFDDQLFRRDAGFSVLLSSKQCRLMLQDAQAEIIEACDVILAQGDAIKDCYEKVAQLSQLEDRPEFIFEPYLEDGETAYLTLNIKNIFYTMNLDRQGRIVILCQIEEDNEDDMALIAPAEIEPFILVVANIAKNGTIEG